MTKRRMLMGATGLALLLGFIVFLVVSLKKAKSRPAEEITLDRSQLTIDRGAYLVNHVLACFGCHSRRNYNLFGAPIVGKPGAGGTCFGEKWGVAGRVCPTNLTPDKGSGIGGFTPGEVIRAVREGVDANGRALHPMMPYSEYRTLSDEDAKAMVSYLFSLRPRTLKRVMRTELDFPTNFFIKSVPQPLDGPVAAPDSKNRVAYGEYLTNVAGCRGCHTPVDSKHQPIEDRAFAGGREFQTPYGVFTSTNITPAASGLKKWTKEAFVQQFIQYRDEAKLRKVKPENNTVMPWLEYAGMTESDMEAIYDYLMTQPAVDG